MNNCGGRLPALALVGLVCGCAANARGPGGGERTQLAFEARASSEFWTRWGDGKAELSGYRVTTERYGELREGRAVLIYVAEPMDSRVWIKDDAGRAPEAYRVQVLKLNRMLSFRTGIYPYAVMTSTFAPVDRIVGRERFAPTKVALSAQEWCGHVYQKLLPSAGSAVHEVRSYFGSEGEASETVATSEDTLYEDGLPIQLRELDGPFNGGRRWSGQLMPSLWRVRKAHRPPRPVAATIERRQLERAGVRVTRFVLEAEGLTRSYDVELAAPHRLLGWSDNQGQRGTLLETARLPYWELNSGGDERHLAQIGLRP